MREIKLLHPDLQYLVQLIKEECDNKGLNILITETMRTKDEQDKLYAQGRTTKGNIVTNCKGYQSPHCWGISFDFCRNERGREYDNTDKFFDKVGKIVKDISEGSLDLFWGGDFKKFVDKPHVEMIRFMPNNSTKWLIANYGNPEDFISTWYDIKEIETGEDDMVRYEKLEDVPEMYRPFVKGLIEKDIINGRGEGVIDLTEDMIRTLIFCDRIKRG